MTKTVEPMPCKKCGKKPAVLWKNGYSYVMCKKCRISTGLVADWDEQMDSKETAINYWNAAMRRSDNGENK